MSTLNGVADESSSLQIPFEEEDSKTPQSQSLKEREKENKHPSAVAMSRRSRHKQSFSMSANHLNHQRDNSKSFSDEKPKNGDNHYDLDVIKQNELIQHLRELKQEYGTRIHDMDSTIQHLTRINEGYESKTTVLQQQNEYLTDATHQWKTRYDETNTMLIDAKQESLNLKTEVLNLQIAYEQDINQLQTNVNDTVVAAADNYASSANHSQQLRQYQRENLQMKRDNKTYLTQLQQVSDQCREQRLKCEALGNIQNDLQNELSMVRARNSELNAMVREYFMEVTSLEQTNMVLKQTLNEIQLQTKDGLYDEEGNAVKISYAPDTARTQRKWRTRSTSQFSATSQYNDSDGNSPVPIVGTNNVDKMENDDIYADSIVFNEDEIFLFPDDDDAKSDQLDRFYDLFQALNDYLHEMGGCVEVIQRLQLLYKKHKKTGKRASRSHILTGFQTPEKSAGAPHIWADRDSDDDEYEHEDMMKVFDVDEEHEALNQMNLVLQHSKECVVELHKQQKIVIDAERMRYHDLEVAHTHFKVQTSRKIKMLTKDWIYSTEYKKYAGYSQICWEMVENMGSYTKEAIIYKLTH